MLSKTLCLHLPSLVYPTNAYGTVEVSSLIQTAALAGLGLLHCGKATRLMVEFFITELTAKNSMLWTSQTATTSNSGPSDTREAVAMAAGWALGGFSVNSGRL